jgi:hypothetical protein
MRTKFLARLHKTRYNIGQNRRWAALEDGRIHSDFQPIPGRF